MNDSTKGENGTKPLWQLISGIDPATESKLDADARDAAIRKLVREVEARATAEFVRAESGKIPEGERTAFWDPLTRICLQLGISRTKLSLYTRELTGMRAHEISDRIFAKRSLGPRMLARIEAVLAPEFQNMRPIVKAPERIFEGHRVQAEERLVKKLREMRSNERRAKFAMKMGFANPSRLSRSVLLAYGMSLDEFEARIVRQLVQKFFDELRRTRIQPPRRQERQEEQKKETVLTAEAQKVIDDAVAYALKTPKREMSVA